MAWSKKKKILKFSKNTSKLMIQTFYLYKCVCLCIKLLLLLIILGKSVSGWTINIWWFCYYYYFFVFNLRDVLGNPYKSTMYVKKKTLISAVTPRVMICFFILKIVHWNWVAWKSWCTRSVGKKCIKLFFSQYKIIALLWIGTGFLGS